MSVATGVDDQAADAAPDEVQPVVAARAASTRPAVSVHDDAWPHTKRILPWSLAGFLAMLCLVPFDSMKLKVSAPIDPTLDRVFLVPMTLLWIAALAAGALRIRKGTSLGPPIYALGGLLVVACLGLVVSLPRLTVDGEVLVSAKAVALLLSYIVFYVMVVTIVRPEEVRRFLYLFLALTCTTGLGTIFEYRTGTNVFYLVAHKVFSAVAIVGQPPAQPLYERATYVGPTSHGLALVVLVTLALPFAINGLLEHKTMGRRILLLIAIALLFGGASATLRRTAGIIPIVVVISLVMIRPRAMVRLAPLGVILVFAVQLMTPGALASIKTMLFGGTLSTQISVQGRTEDYDAVGPDVWDKPLLGRGYGSYEPRTYRFIDNQYLLTTLDSGLIGLLAYLGVGIAIVLALWRLARSSDAARAGPAAAIIAGCLAFFVASAFFDILSFPQAPYALFFCVALGMIVRGDSRRTTAAELNTSMSPVMA
jgi:O-antigen ligase